MNKKIFQVRNSTIATGGEVGIGINAINNFVLRKNTVIDQIHFYPEIKRGTQLISYDLATCLLDCPIGPDVINFFDYPQIVSMPGLATFQGVIQFTGTYSGYPCVLKDLGLRVKADYEGWVLGGFVQRNATFLAGDILAGVWYLHYYET